MHDLVIRGGTIIGGIGKAPFTGDDAIAEGRIAGVGAKQGPARRETDAGGLLVAPGWVDVGSRHLQWDSPTAAPWTGTVEALEVCGRRIEAMPQKMKKPRRSHTLILAAELAKVEPSQTESNLALVYRALIRKANQR
jgi:imidazolonepropionase-like amidohydrolase